MSAARRNKMANSKLVGFIREARRRGFEDYEIRAPLLKKGWPAVEVEAAFESLRDGGSVKNQVCISLKPEILKMIERRAKKNILSIHEQVEDILRRSCVGMRKKAPGSEKIDDLLVSIFSRRKYGKGEEK
jgi:hypothetical protein